MLGSRTQVAAVLAVLVAGALGSMGSIDNVRRDFGMGVILPRAASNLQAFQGALGGASAQAVCFSLRPSLRCSSGGGVAAGAMDSHCFSAAGPGRSFSNLVCVCSSLQITQSNDPTRQFEVAGDTFVSRPMGGNGTPLCVRWIFVRSAY